MSGFEMFCERCGKRYGSEEAPAAASLPLARRLLKVVGVGATARRPHEEPLLRFCLACRGYSCPACWNEDAGFCQTCVPLPEPEPVAAEPTFDRLPQMVFDAAPEPGVDPMPAALFAEPVVESVLEPVSADTWVAEPVVADPPWVVGEADPPWVEAEAVFAEPEAEPVVAEAEAVVAEAEAVFAEPEAEPVVAEAEAVVAEAEAVHAEPEVEAEAVVAEAEAVYAEPEVEAEPVVAEAEAEAEPVPMFAELEPPAEAAYAEDASYTEPEPDVLWDWSLEPSSEPEPIAETEPALATEPPRSEEPTLPETPTQPAVPIFRPLEPMGPIMPPPPPPAAALPPRIEFELSDPPPAFLLARPPVAPALRPTLPVGLFDGPGPQVRPCPNCELPVSAKAHFCRRCGSAQS